MVTTTVIIEVIIFRRKAFVTYLFAKNFCLAISLIRSWDRPISATISIIIEKAKANEYCPSCSVPSCLAM